MSKKYTEFQKLSKRFDGHFNKLAGKLGSHLNDKLNNLYGFTTHISGEENFIFHDKQLAKTYIDGFKEACDDFEAQLNISKDPLLAQTYLKNLERLITNYRKTIKKQERKQRRKQERRRKQVVKESVA